jgi:hypothetical protein
VVFATVVTGAAVVAVPLPEPVEFDVEPLPGVETLPPLLPVEPEPAEPDETVPAVPTVEPTPTVVVDEPSPPDAETVDDGDEPSEGMAPSGNEVVDVAETSVGVAPSTFGLPFAQLESAAVASRHRASRWGSRWEGIIRVLLGR